MCERCEKLERALWMLAESPLRGLSPCWCRGAITIGDEGQVEHTTICGDIQAALLASAAPAYHHGSVIPREGLSSDTEAMRIAWRFLQRRVGDGAECLTCGGAEGKNHEPTDECGVVANLLHEARLMQSHLTWWRVNHPVPAPAPAGERTKCTICGLIYDPANPPACGSPEGVQGLPPEALRYVRCAAAPAAQQE